MGKYADKKRMEFWDEIYDKAGVQHLHDIFTPYRDEGQSIIKITSDTFCDYFDEEIANQTYFYHPPKQIVVSKIETVSKSSALEIMNVLYIIFSFLLLLLRRF